MMHISAAYSFGLEVAIKSTAMLGLAWLAARVFRRKSAASRHLIWSLALAGLLMLPVLSLVLPALRVPVAERFVVPEVAFRADVVGSSQQPQQRGVHSELTPKRVAALMDWRLAMMLIWAGGAVVSLAQMLIGWASVERLTCKAKALGSAGGVPILEGSEGSMPMTYGVFRPTIFVPPDASEWSEERRRIVLLHELAHVRRNDVLMQLLARAALSFYWWNPLAWFGWRTFLQERERAADDLVLNGGVCGSEYARELLEIACSMQPEPTGWPVVAMASRSQLERRLMAILASGLNRRAPRRAGMIAAAVAALCVIVPLAAMETKSNLTQTNGTTQLTGLMKVGDEALDQGKYDQAKAVYDKVLATGSGAERFGALIHRGAAEMATKDFTAAIGDFELAETVDSSKAGDVRMWKAIAKEKQGNLEAASALYQSSLEAADGHSAVAADLMDLYSKLLDKQGKAAEATAMRKQSYEIRTALAEETSEKREAQSDVHRAGGDTKPPTLITKVEPGYAGEARVIGYSGTVVLTTVIGDDGLAHETKIVRGLGFGLNEKALEAVSRWKFKPGSRDGNPVKVRATIEVSFQLL